MPPKPVLELRKRLLLSGQGALIVAGNCARGTTTDIRDRRQRHCSISAQTATSSESRAQRMAEGALDRRDGESARTSAESCGSIRSSGLSPFRARGVRPRHARSRRGTQGARLARAVAPAGLGATWSYPSELDPKRSTTRGPRRAARGVREGLQHQDRCALAERNGRSPRQGDRGSREGLETREILDRRSREALGPCDGEAVADPVLGEADGFPKKPALGAQVDQVGEARAAGPGGAGRAPRRSASNRSPSPTAPDRRIHPGSSPTTNPRPGRADPHVRPALAAAASKSWGGHNRIEWPKKERVLSSSSSLAAYGQRGPAQPVDGETCDRPDR